MHTMFEDGQRKVAQGLTTIEELLRVVPPPEDEESSGSGPDQQASAAPARAPRSIRPPRVLIVDADAASVHEMQEALTAQHVDTAVVSTPQQGLAHVYRESPDLVIADVVGAPGMDGLDLLRRI